MNTEFINLKIKYLKYIILLKKIFNIGPKYIQNVLFLNILLLKNCEHFLFP